MAGNQSFWSDAKLEPKRQHRWLLYIGGPGGAPGRFGIPTYLIKKVDKPKYAVNETVHSYFGHKFYYPGNVTWQPISFTVIDPIVPDTTERFYELLLGSGYNVPDSQEVSTVSKDLAVKELGEMITLQQLDSNNVVVDEFQLHNPWVTSVDFGSLSYDSDAILEINVNVRYDYAKFNTGTS